MRLDSELTMPGPHPTISEELGILFGTLYLPNTRLYCTEINYFPSTNCLPRWGLEGVFQATAHLYKDGMVVAQCGLRRCDQNGCLSFNSDHLNSILDSGFEGLAVLEIHHTKSIPIDLYASHVHKGSGVYVAYPPAVFMGDTIYTLGHEQQLENSLFWPGVVDTEGLESSLRVLNPFNSLFHYELTLITPEGEKVQSTIFKLRPYTATTHRVADVFPELMPAVRASGDRSFALCISAQFKICAHFIIHERETGIFTSVDHLHQYCMF